MSRRKREAVACAAAAQEKQFAEQHLGWKKYTGASQIGIAVVLLLVVVFGAIGAFSEKYKNSFAAESNTSTNPVAEPLIVQSATPQLAKEYIYSGSRMLATEEPSNVLNGSDLVVWRNSNGTWYIRDAQDPNVPYVGQAFGANGDIPAPADFNGDDLYDFCVYRPNYPVAGQGTWFYMPNGTSTMTSYTYGLSTDVPVPADYDGDRRADIALYRSSATAFYIVRSSDGTLQTIIVGQAGDKAVVADYDGDGRADGATYRAPSGASNATWSIKPSSSNSTKVEHFGAAADEPVAGDYDGDGRFDLAIRRPSDNSWYYLSSSTNQMIGTQWGVATDTAVPGDYDADGKTDVAVWRSSSGYWYIRQSKYGFGMRSEHWGAAGDIPIAAPFKR